MSKTDVMPRPAAKQEIDLPQPDTQAWISLVERLATNPATNVDTLERLLAMQERVIDRQAKAAYTVAMIAMKPKLPVIDRKVRIQIFDKADKTKLIQSTAFAKWEDIDEAISPILAEHGFALTFRTGVATDGKITVTGVLSHQAGHGEETTITLPHDSSGSKNAVQAVGSSTSYGKRYTATLLLNLRTKGEDDDGKAAGEIDCITPEQAQDIEDKIKEVGANKEKFLQVLGFESVETIRVYAHKTALALLNEKANKSKRAK